MDIDKIRKRKLIYENGKKLLLEKYATNPTLEKQIEETNLVLDTLDFCLYCIGDANQYNAVVAQNKSLQGELRQQKELNKKLILVMKKVDENSCMGCGLFVHEICHGEKTYELNGKKHWEICMEHRNNKLRSKQYMVSQALQELEAEND